jgi:hypothetical protein
MKFDTAVGRVELNRPLYVNGSIGSLGQVLTSQGAGLPPTWSTSAYVPYTGATSSLNLGSNNVNANAFIKLGGTSSQFLKADGTVDNNTYLTSATISGLVPYTGATGAVDLGTNTLSVGDINISNTKQLNLISNNQLNLLNNSQINIGNNSYLSFNSNSYLIADGSIGIPGQVLSSNGFSNTPTWVSIPNYLLPKYGSFYDTTTQTTVGLENLAMKLNSTDSALTDGFSITNNALSQPTRITCATIGKYNIQFSAQLHNTGSGASQVWIWFRKNGVDLADSATTVTLENNDLLVASWNYFVNLTSVGDYVEIMWRVNNNHTEIQRNTTTTGVPDIPSVIVTVNRIS